LVELLDRQKDAAQRAAALRYATQLVAVAEKVAQRPKPAEVADGKWRESHARLLAAAYLARGKVHAGSGEIAPAIADYEKSFAAYPTAEVAERLGDLNVQQGDAARGIEEYATAFSFPGRDVDPAQRDELRRKLGSIYLAQHGSEKGLGDLILRRYDELMRSIGARFADQHSANADRQDPFDFVLGRPDGTSLRLADFRGKVVVMDFWATWCPPCRVEGKLLERVEESFHNEPAAAFLAVNVDEDRDGVASFLTQERWTTPVVYAQGLDHLLGVRSLPTLVIFDRTGRVVFREEGLDLSTFVETLEKKVRDVLAQPAVATASQ
ncbi:MAG: TlpA family protein disulfide reductase, partial [Acidobacteriia bacterium]|nr:TlpA family protein disulfide reductase [Terriglobia bacterium]